MHPDLKESTFISIYFSHISFSSSGWFHWFSGRNFSRCIKQSCQLIGFADITTPRIACWIFSRSRPSSTTTDFKESSSRLVSASNSQAASSHSVSLLLIIVFVQARLGFEGELGCYRRKFVAWVSAQNANSCRYSNYGPSRFGTNGSRHLQGIRRCLGSCRRNRASDNK